MKTWNWCGSLVRVASWIAFIGAAWAGVAFAAPAPAPAYPLYPTLQESAEQLFRDGDYEEALPIIKEALQNTPNSLPLLWLEGEVLQKLRDYPGAVAAFQAYLRSGAKGESRRRARQIINHLRPAQSTFLEVTLENGPAEIYLESKSLGVLCTAAPSCRKGVLPDEYTVIAERPGYEAWVDEIKVENGQTAKLTIKLAERKSLILVRTTAPNTRVTIDGTAHHTLVEKRDTPAGDRAVANGTPYYVAHPVAPGTHEITVSRAGHIAERFEVTAREGRPVEVVVVLAPFTPVRVSPSHAELVLDDKPVVLDEGALEIPPGAHVLVARAQGFHDRRIHIPAERAADYKLDIELERIAPPAAPRVPAVSAVPEDPEPSSPRGRATVARRARTR